MNTMAANAIPPRDPESAILSLLEKSGSPIPVGDVIGSAVQQYGFDDVLIRQVIWQLLSNGEIELSSDRKLEIRKGRSNAGKSL